MISSLNIRKRRLMSYLDTQDSTYDEPELNPLKRKCSATPPLSPISLEPPAKRFIPSILTRLGKTQEKKSAEHVEKIKKLVAKYIISKRKRLVPNSTAIDNHLLEPGTSTQHTNSQFRNENIDDGSQDDEERRLTQSAEIFDAIFINVNGRNLRKSNNKLQKPIKREKSESISSLIPSQQDTTNGNANYPYTHPYHLSTVVIGPNETTIPTYVYLGINWKCPVTTITKKLVNEIFNRETLATHIVPDWLCSTSTATEKIINEIMNRETLATDVVPDKHSPIHGLNTNEKILDPAKIEDIVHIVTLKKQNATEEQVYSAIQTKCNELRNLRTKKFDKALEDISKIV